MQVHLNQILDEPAMPSVIDANLLCTGANEAELDQILRSADTILDMSASVPVARKLAYDPENPARRCSVFLNPAGSALVVLCEDRDRRVRLDWLEFQYYRELMKNQELTKHFEQPGDDPVRYARSCRAVTSRVAEHLIAMYSGIASFALQKCLVEEGAVGCIWQNDASMNVKTYPTGSCPVIDLTLPGWRVCTDEAFVKTIRQYRTVKLPKETGGVLLGNFDQEKRIIYLVDALPSPADSEEWPTLYIRGTHGLDTAVQTVRERTNHQLQYLGEWHSHPNGYGTKPSKDDGKVFAWLTEHAARDGNPPVMVIAGTDDIRIFVGSVNDWVLTN